LIASSGTIENQLHAERERVNVLTISISASTIFAEENPRSAIIVSSMPIVILNPT
jgi:hypothetical protein